MVASKHSSIAVPSPVADNACAALQQAHDWIMARELQHSDVSRELVAFLARARADLSAAVPENDVMKTIAITTEHGKGTAIDVISRSLERVEAVAEALGLLHSDFETEPTPHCVYMLSTIVEDHVRMAREALDALLDQREGRHG